MPPTLQNTNVQVRSQADAFSEYHLQIDANPNREYAIIQRGQSGDYAVIIGNESSVVMPANMASEWRIKTHYHPNFEWLNTKLKKISGSNFKARIPSPDDMLGASSASTMGGKVPVRERLDWMNPDLEVGVKHKTVYSTHFGFEPGPPEVWWVEHASEMGGMAPRKSFNSVKDYTTWYNSLEEAGPPTVRNPSAK